MANPRSLVNRMIRAAGMEVSLYEEVEADTTANSQALIAVIIVALATSIGTGIAGFTVTGLLGLYWGLVAGLAYTLVGWLAWSYITYLLGTTVLKGPNTSATWGELVRAIGFAHSPLVFRILAPIPFVGGPVTFFAFIWALIAGVVAVRQALDISTGRAIAVSVVGWLVYVAIYISVFLLLWGIKGFF